MKLKNKKQLILEAAFEVFGNKNYANARVEEIAEKAGVGKGTIYEYFQSKAHLFLEMHKWQMEEYLARIEKGLSREASPSENIYMLIKNHTLFTKKFNNIAGRLVDEVGFNTEFNKEHRQVMLNTYKRLLSRVKEILDTGILMGEFRPMDSQLVADVLFGTMGGISHAMILSGNKQDVEEVSRTITDLLLNGMLNKRSM